MLLYYYMLIHVYVFIKHAYVYMNNLLLCKELIMGVKYFYLTLNNNYK